MILDRLFGNEISAGDRLFLLKCLMNAVKELSDNPKKYLPDEFDNLGKEIKDFYFKKVKTKICNFQNF